MMRLSTLISVALLWQLTPAASASWNSFNMGQFRTTHRSHSEHEEEHWTGICVNGHHQSPIDIVLGDIETVHYDKLKFNNYHIAGPVVIENDGHSGKVSGFTKWEQPPSITGGKLGATYFLKQFHMHWSSEHTFYGMHYDAELHLVHISEKYDKSKNMSLAGNVAVVAVSFLAGEDEAELEGIDALYEDGHVSGPKTNVSFKPGVLLPTDITTYYRYSGSLTTPPCTEDVMWTIFAEPVVISNRQLHALKKAHLHEDADEVQNIRKTQPMYGRKLYLNRAKSTFIDTEKNTRMLLISAIVVLLVVVPPLVVVYVLYKRSALEEVVRTNSSNTLHTIDHESEHGSRSAETEVPRDLPGPSGLTRGPSGSRSQTETAFDNCVYTNSAMFLHPQC